MNVPADATWQRVEELAEELGKLSPSELTQRISTLAEAGESPTVLTVLGTWLSLPPPPTSLRPGALLGGRYLLREMIGEGGMGSVWRAHQELIGRDVAVKIIHPFLVSPAFSARFCAEMKALGQLNHPCIVRIFDAGLHEPAKGPATPFFAMELIEGERLDTWAEKRRTQRVEILSAISSVCAALAAAHELQIVHRDLKPSNILMRPNGQPVIVDFGVARLRGLIVGETEGAFSGTPNYAAPEQHLGRDHDFRSGESVDIYAIGALLFETLSGRKLFETPPGASVLEIREFILESRAPKLFEVIPDCPPALEEIVSRASRRDPADRFYSVAALGRAIDRVCAEIAAPQSPRSRWMPAARALIPNSSWVLIEKIGEGGAGEVWVGAHRQLGEQRVFKFCDDEEKARTLKREVTFFRLLKEHVGRNPHFIPLQEVSLDEPPYYLMMDHVEALELEKWCATQPGGLAGLPEKSRLEVVIQSADALQAAHDAGILHRDVKPANLLLRGDQETLHVFVADFGIGQLVTEQLLRDRTRLGFTRTVSELRTDRLSGTLLYLAPEVLEGGQATVRSDIYSLGIVLWQLLVGNLHAALDASDWPARIEDPILREILRRCLAGAPDKRWASAADLAASLRALPETRAMEHKRREEIALRERTAYRRGIFRTAGVAAMILIAIAALGIAALQKRHEAEAAHGAIALQQAQNLSRSESAGRRGNGLHLLDLATKTASDPATLRTAAATVLGLTDLIPGPIVGPNPASASTVNFPKLDREVARALSPNGDLVAIGLDRDGRNGSVDVLDAKTGKSRISLARTEFPWMPVAESSLLKFSANQKMLAVGGSATSRQLLIFDLGSAALRAYIYHGADLLSVAWHPDDTLIATGAGDGLVRIWDISAAQSPRHTGRSSQRTNQFDVQSLLDSLALDEPLVVLQGQRGPVTHLCFGPSGRWLAVLDDTGYLRLFTGFREKTLGDVAGSGAEGFSDGHAVGPALAVEFHVDDPGNVKEISTTPDQIHIEWSDGRQRQIHVLEGRIPAETRVAPGLAKLAWNDANELCISTLTDLWWLRTSALNAFFAAKSMNPLAIGASAGKWLVATEKDLESFSFKTGHGVFAITNQTRLSWNETNGDQSPVVEFSVTRDGRLAVYRGRRVHFFRNDVRAPEESAILAKQVGGRLRDFAWDAPGELLAILVSSANGFSRLEAWKTSHDFPPTCQPAPPLTFACDRIAPANRGARLVCRSKADGVFLWSATDAKRVALDASVQARQDAPIAVRSDGSLLACVVDRNIIRLLELPSGRYFADLHSARPSSIVRTLSWSPSGDQLAGLTEDGSVDVWDLKPWQEWLVAHHLEYEASSR